MDRTRRFELDGTEKTCFIFGAGSFYGLFARPKPGDLLIAADGGMRYLEALSLVPDLLIGDLDSLKADGGFREDETPASIQIRRLSVTKDLSDSASAIKEGISRGYRRFFLYGCTGGRLDHTIATLQDLAALSEQGMEGYLFSEREVLTAVTDCKIEFPERLRGTISVFSHTDESLGVSESGLKYTVAEHRLTNRFPLGLSNAFTGLPASVAVKKGTLLISVSLQQYGTEKSGADKLKEIFTHPSLNA